MWRNGEEVLIGYSIRGELLYFHGKLVLPHNSPTMPLLLEVFHSSSVGVVEGFFALFRGWNERFLGKV